MAEDAAAEQLAEKTATDEVKELLAAVVEGSKSSTELMTVCTKHVLTDTALRDQLKAAAGTLSLWTEAAERLSAALDEEVKGLHQKYAVLQGRNRSLMVDKRKLEMTRKELLRKADLSERKLQEVLAGLQLDDGAAAGGGGGGTREASDAPAALEAKLVVAEATLKQKEEETQESHKELQELRQKVLDLSSEADAAREAQSKAQAKAEKLLKSVTALKKAGKAVSDRPFSLPDVLQHDAPGESKQPPPPPPPPPSRRPPAAPVSLSRRDNHDEDPPPPATLFKPRPQVASPLETLTTPTSLASNAVTAFVCLALGFALRGGGGTSTKRE